jgi:hypothetical protein
LLRESLRPSTNSHNPALPIATNIDLTVLNCGMNEKLRWLIYIFIAVATAIGVAFTSSDAGLIDCLLVGLGNGVFNFFLVEVVFKKE